MTTFLEVKNLSVSFPTEDGLVQATNEVSYHVDLGETLAIVGESGSGKSVTNLAVMGLHNPGKTNISGEAILHLPEGPIDVIKASEDKVRKLRGSAMSMIFQDPMSSLHPYYSVGDQISEAWLLYNQGDKKKAHSRAIEMLDLVGIPEAKKRVNEFPHQFSGGMRQRVMIAIALIGEPQILIADEPTTALDVGIQAQVMSMINLLATKKNLTVILISHDLGVVAGFADIVLVMYGGKIVERGSADDIFLRARHPYTKALLNSIPTVMRDRSILLPTIDGVTVDPTNRPAGCIFQDRCPAVQSLCKVEVPKEVSEGANHRYSCFFPNMEDAA